MLDLRFERAKTLCHTNRSCRSLDSCCATTHAQRNSNKVCVALTPALREVGHLAGPRTHRGDHGRRRLAHRACAALRAISRRRSGARWAARPGPPLSPPIRPSAAACGLASIDTLRDRSTSRRSVGAPHAGHGDPIASVPLGSVITPSTSHTKHWRLRLSSCLPEGVPGRAVRLWADP